jgi:hypothetical protein
VREAEERDAEHFGCAARLLIEAELENLASDSPARRDWTGLLIAVKNDPVHILRELRRVDGRGAEAWVHAGREHQRRLQIKLARFINEIAAEDVNSAA